MHNIIFILSASIFDSLATTQQIIIFVLMFTTIRPIKNSLSYLLGLLSSYYLCGFIGYKTLDKLKPILSFLFPTDKMPDNTYYKIELFIGIIFIIVAYVYYNKQKNSQTAPMENIIISKLKHMNLLVAFGIGILISVTSFPFSIPYIAVLGKLTSLNMNITTVLSSLLIYNFGYALPMIIIFGIYMFMRHSVDNIEDNLHNKAKSLNIKLTTWVMIGLGLLSIIDAIMYFISGHPLIKNRMM